MGWLLDMMEWRKLFLFNWCEDAETVMFCAGMSLRLFV